MASTIAMVVTEYWRRTFPLNLIPAPSFCLHSLLCSSPGKARRIYPTFSLTHPVREGILSTSAVPSEPHICKGDTRFMYTVSPRERTVTLIGIMVALLLGALDQTIVATAMPRILQ